MGHFYYGSFIGFELYFRYFILIYFLYVAMNYTSAAKRRLTDKQIQNSLISDLCIFLITYISQRHEQMTTVSNTLTENRITKVSVN